MSSDGASPNKPQATDSGFLEAPNQIKPPKLKDLKNLIKKNRNMITLVNQKMEKLQN